MKKNYREIAGFLFIFISIFSFIGAYVMAAGDMVPAQKIFESKCAQCHGKDGKGVAKMVKVLKVDAAKLDLTREDAVKKTSAESEKIVTNGQKKMPKYKGKLTPTQIHDVVEYLNQTLHKK